MQILLQTLESIISHHKKSASVSYNAKSEAILHLQLLFINVSNLQSTHFSVENFFLAFFLSLYRAIKKVKARCIKQKSEGHGPASAGVSDSTCSGSEECAASSSHSLSVSGILHWREGRRRNWCRRVGWGGGALGGFQMCPLQLLLPSDPALLVCQNTPLWHLGWQTQLLSFEYFCYIQIEEVAVEDGLHHPSDNGDHVKESLKVEPPYPVDEV